MQGNETRRSHASAARPGRRHWSAIDAALILLVAAAVAVQVWQAFLVRREQQAQKTPTMYDVTFTVTNVRAEVLDEIAVNDVLYLCADGLPLGVIGAYENEDDGSGDEGPDESMPASPFAPYDGTLITTTGRMICTDGEAYEGGLLFPDNGFVLTPGSEITLRTEKVLLTVRIERIAKHVS